MRRKFFSRKELRLFFFCCIFFLSATRLFAQHSLSVQGQIVDANTLEPLIGVSVLEKGTTNGTVTDLDGRFSLQSSQGATIVFSYISYLTQELKAEKVKDIIRLNEDAKTLDEVVVVGYGVQKKVNLSGAVSSIEGDAIASKPSSDVLSSLQGELPGVAVLRGSGQPGSEASGIRIRGFSSTNSAKTLILIDGVEGNLTMLNPSDIESISVLKDAAASAIYGARAAAGVVLVTTKNGKTGKPQVTYNGYFAINTPGNMPKRLPAWEEQIFINEARINTGGTAEWSEEQSSWIANPNFNYRPNASNGRWDFFQATNWIDEGVKDYTTQHNHSVSVSGGSQEFNYIVSANYFAKNGLLKYGPDSNERFNMRAKINVELNNYMSFALNTNYRGQFTQSASYGAENILERLYRVRGRQPVYNPAEDINESPYNGDLQQNAIDIMKNGGNKKSRNESFMAKGTLTIKNVVKGLRVNLSASRNTSYYSQVTTKRHLIWYDRLGTSIRSQVNNPNELNKKKNNNYHDLFEATVNYDLKFGKHAINLLGGSTYENYRKDEIEATAKNMISNDFFSFNYYDAGEVTNTILKDLIAPWSMMSYFGRMNYSFMDRYLFEANVRYDGSSRLARNKRWKAFPSFSVAWRINEEGWFNVNVINNFKIRASWGQLGNGAALGLYDYLPLINNGKHLDEEYYYQSILASESKSWETIESTNLGFDMGLLNNRLNITADYYWKYNNNMLAAMNLPSQIGIETPSANVGKLKTWGWDFVIGWSDKIKDVSYQVNFNISDSQDRLAKYNGVNVVSAGTIGLLEGHPINTIWGYKTDGYWKSREEYLEYKKVHPGYESFQDGKISGGDVKYLAQGDGKHKVGAGGGTPEDSGDLVCLGTSTGRYLYGLNLSMQWKGFDFSMMFQGVGKRALLINSGTLAPLSQSSSMPWTIHRNYSKVDSDGKLVEEGYWPRLYNYNDGEIFNYHASDKWVQDASYLRLKNVTLGYTIPVKKEIFERLRVYVSGADLWEHTNLLSVFDPEVRNNAGATYYPFFRTWTMGLNVTF